MIMRRIGFGLSFPLFLLFLGLTAQFAQAQLITPPDQRAIGAQAVSPAAGIPEWNTLVLAGRASHSAVYDSANQRMVIFGGFNGTTAFRDVWAFSLTANTWTQISTS